MFPFPGPPVDDNVIRPLNDDDQRVLLGLVHRYGLNSLMCALTGLGESCKSIHQSVKKSILIKQPAPRPSRPQPFSAVSALRPSYGPPRMVPPSTRSPRAMALPLPT